MLQVLSRDVTSLLMMVHSVRLWCMWRGLNSETFFKVCTALGSRCGMGVLLNAMKTSLEVQCCMYTKSEEKQTSQQVNWTLVLASGLQA